MALIREGIKSQKGELRSSSSICSSATASVCILRRARGGKYFGYGSHDLGDLAGNLQGRSTRERAEDNRI